MLELLKRLGLLVGKGWRADQASSVTCSMLRVAAACSQGGRLSSGMRALRCVSFLSSYSWSLVFLQPRQPRITVRFQAVPAVASFPDCLLKTKSNRCFGDVLLRHRGALSPSKHSYLPTLQEQASCCHMRNSSCMTSIARKSNMLASQC